MEFFNSKYFYNNEPYDRFLNMSVFYNRCYFNELTWVGGLNAYTCLFLMNTQLNI